MESIDCKQCGGQMRRTKRNEHNFALQVLGVVVFLIGLALLFVFPIGTFFGICLMLASTRLGFTRRRVWMCDGCGYFFERAR